MFDKIDKAQAMRIISECALAYHDNLLNRNLLFLYKGKQGPIETFESTFISGNFVHLTGVVTKDKAAHFYSKAISKRLRIDSFELADDGTTEMKLRILPYLMKRNLGASMVGEFANNRISLRTDKLVGNTYGCIGFVLNDSDGYYYPNTALNLDLRDEPGGYKRIIAIYRKQINEPQFTECVYMAKKVDIKTIQIPSGYDYLKEI